MASFVMWSQTTSSQGDLLSIRSKIFVKLSYLQYFQIPELPNYSTFKYLNLSLIFDKFSSFVCLCCLYGGFFSEKPQKNKWSNFCLLRVREDSKFLDNTQNGWLWETLESWKFSVLPTLHGVWKVRHFLTNLFQKLYPSWFTCYFIDWWYIND